MYKYMHIYFRDILYQMQCYNTWNNSKEIAMDKIILSSNNIKFKKKMIRIYYIKSN